jgi:hypothetical protein
MTDREERLEDALQQIAHWADAYPLDVFPIPDWQRAREVLEANGMTLDAISAGCMRLIILGVGKIARDALALDAGPAGEEAPPPVTKAAPKPR